MPLTSPYNCIHELIRQEEENANSKFTQNYMFLMLVSIDGESCAVRFYMRISQWHLHSYVLVYNHAWFRGKLGWGGAIVSLIYM